jgi:transmembrane sensor
MKPTPAAISHQGDEAIEANAAVWLSLRDRGMSEAETAEFMRWLQQDARHASVFAELDQVWQTFDRLEASTPAGETKTETIRLAPRARPARAGWVAAVLATAAAVTIGFLTWSHPFGRSAATPLGGLVPS